MYKVFVNGVQMGNYRTLRELAVAVTGLSCLGRQGGAESCEWRGREMRIRTRIR